MNSYIPDDSINVSQLDSNGKQSASMISHNLSKEIIKSSISPYSGPFINNFVCGCKPTIIVVDDQPFNIRTLKSLIYNFKFPQNFPYSYKFLRNLFSQASSSSFKDLIKKGFFPKNQNYLELKSLQQQSDKIKEIMDQIENPLHEFEPCTDLQNIQKNSIFQVFSAENGLQAINMFQERLDSHCPNINCKVYNCRLILMDIQMPVMNGIEASQRILNIQQMRKLQNKIESQINSSSAIDDKIKFDSDVSIVAVSAYQGQDIKDECLKAGMIDFINKPISMKQLKFLIAKYHFKMEDFELKEFMK